MSVRRRQRRATPADDPADERRRARAVRQALERLGPFYVKLGQLLSARPDMVPPAMIAELENLHDQVEVLPFTRLETVLEQDLGPGWRRRFQDIDTAKPLGSASIAQAHRATLTGGRPVVIKIQRPPGARILLTPANGPQLDGTAHRHDFRPEAPARSRQGRVQPAAACLMDLRRRNR